MWCLSRTKEKLKSPEEDMDKLTNELQCPQCGARFPVELGRMRVNVPNSCPSCGFECRISEDQAIKAHRFLERLEYGKKIVSPVSQSVLAKPA